VQLGETLTGRKGKDKSRKSGVNKVNFKTKVENKGARLYNSQIIQVQALSYRTYKIVCCQILFYSQAGLSMRL
jgi:hypothetical protein